jgi:tRNA(adenine34) deaminase
MITEPHEHYMKLAIEEALLAELAGEVPVGAVVVNSRGEIVGTGGNRPISACDPTAHAEMVAIRQAALHLQNYRLVDTTLYCTVEPCPMCAGAMIHSRILRLVFGAPDLKAGAAGSVYNILTDPRLNHRVEVTRGVCEIECTALVQQFFSRKRP